MVMAGLVMTSLIFTLVACAHDQRRNRDFRPCLTPPKGRNLAPMKRILVAGVTIALALAACGKSNDNNGASTTSSSTAPATSTSTSLAGLEQPAIWPTADTYFATPAAAASDFVSKVLGVPPVLGDFQQGDTTSGEMLVYSQPEGSSQKTERSRLLLRQLGARHGWFITAAVNDSEVFSSPVARATVSAGSLTVTGKGRGFEALVLVQAFVAGNATKLASAQGHGGSMATPEAFSVTLDLSAAHPGDTVMLLMKGGVGLETDPGDFSAIPVVVS